ncbi:MAG TPA: helix-turn-helix domain-containing protein [Pseudonocardiaceae bacterium]|nr:helix-turn-helix domain-containing protein [Pseudonocardiaceae bacterium]
MTSTTEDDLWTAIGDPTRRRLLDLLLADGSGTATSLSGHLPVTRQAVAKHLSVLERAELVVPRKDGREVRYVINEAQFARAVGQLASVGAAWDARLRHIKMIAESIQALQSTTESETGSNRGTHRGRKSV